MASGSGNAPVTRSADIEISKPYLEGGRWHNPKWFKYSLSNDKPRDLTADELQIDIVLLSHDHYDHLNMWTVKRLNQRFAPDIHWFVGMGTKSILEKERCTNVHEYAWDEAFDFGPDISIRCLPSRHSCARGMFDIGKRLWASWAVIGPHRRFFFVGDSGFCPIEFDQIGKKYGPFDVAAIPIGCFSPRHLMESEHMDPDEAMKTHNLAQCLHTVGIHWATFPLGQNEDWDAPKVRIEELSSTANGGTEFRATCPGYTWKIK